MSRNLYYNLIKIIFGSMLVFIYIPSFVYLICSLLLDKNLNITSLILTVSCVVLWILLVVVLNIINRISKNKIVFEKGIILYKGRTIYADNVSIKYFRFHISIVEPSLVIPKLYINGNNLSVTCYLSKRDIKKLQKLNYAIKSI